MGSFLRIWLEKRTKVVDNFFFRFIEFLLNILCFLVQALIINISKEFLHREFWS